GIDCAKTAGERSRIVQLDDTPPVLVNGDSAPDWSQAEAVHHYIAVDIGGTFTDCVLVDSGGRHVTAKALSTQADPVEGVRAALTRLGEQIDSDLPTMLASTLRFSHGTTIGTNAVLERRGARVGLVPPGGHGDALAMMRGRGRVAARPTGEGVQSRGPLPPAPFVVAGSL